ncbi:hypothetical protein BAL199_07583 [alpha proteobacterium BAL199]|jgi:hypothetical protein|nr:hypothetical protein BAL199_07583 [alpha proteobacterium BAL199]
MAVQNYDTAAGDGVAIGSPNVQGRIVVLPEQNDATDWHSYPSGQEYTVTALSHFHFRREVRNPDGSTSSEVYELQAGSTIKRVGPFEHRVTNLATTPAVFIKG